MVMNWHQADIHLLLFKKDRGATGDELPIRLCPEAPADDDLFSVLPFFQFRNRSMIAANSWEKSSMTP